MSKEATQSQFPTKDEFILAMRKHKDYKRQWIAEMDVKLAAIEEQLKLNSESYDATVALYD